MSKSAGAIVAVIFIVLASAASAAREGATPEDVAIAQGLLVRLGYDPGPVDGVYGARTTQAIRLFHETHEYELPLGEIELQTAAVVDNLITAFVAHLMEPSKSTSSLYRAAIAGDGNAAIELGFMYLQGRSVVADPMMAYFWWTVAESTGTSRIINMKDWLKASGRISNHEIACARRLVVQLNNAVHNR
ncbi:MAG: peptidoglycan-binding protein [Geminicoccaceae bacterium]